MTRIVCILLSTKTTACALDLKTVWNSKRTHAPIVILEKAPVKVRKQLFCIFDALHLPYANCAVAFPFPFVGVAVVFVGSRSEERRSGEDMCVSIGDRCFV